MAEENQKLGPTHLAILLASVATMTAIALQSANPEEAKSNKIFQVAAVVFCLAVFIAICKSFNNNGRGVEKISMASKGEAQGGGLTP